MRASAHILREDGYRAASTNRIAERAGVSIGSLYQYFPSKQAIMNALLEAHVAHMNAELTRVVQELGDAPLEDVVRTFISAMMQAHAHDPILHRVLSESVHELGGLARVRELVQPGMMLVRTYLALRADRIREVDPEVATFVLVNAVEAVTHAYFFQPPHGSIGIEQLTQELCVLVERYLARPGPAEL